MASRNALGKIAGTALGSLKDPVGTAGKVFEQAKGSAAFGMTVLGRAAETAAQAIEQRRKHADEEEPTLRDAPDVNEPAHTVTPPAPPRRRTPSPGRTSPPAREAAQKSPAKKTTAKKAPAKKAAPGQPPAADVGATPADLARKTTGEGTSKKAAKKAPAKKTTAKKTTARRTPAKKSPPRTAEQVATDQGEDVDTPAGTPGAGRATNPDTAEHDLNQPGTPGVMDESTVSEVISESETLRKAAERDPE